MEQATMVSGDSGRATVSTVVRAGWRRWWAVVQALAVTVDSCGDG